MGVLGDMKAPNKPPVTVASAATLNLPAGGKFSVTGSTTVTSLGPTHSSLVGRRITLIGGASASVPFTNTDNASTAGQMELGGNDITLGQDDFLILELTSSLTWRRVSSTDN